MIKSPLRYPGGKTRAVNFLSQLVPEYEEFREPFFGGGSMSFYMLQKNPNAKYFANDLNYELYCFWQTLKTSPDKLIEEISRIKNATKEGKSLFYDLMSKRESNLTEFERAVHFFVLNRITFSGVVDSGGYSEAAFHGRYTQSSIERLKEAYKIVKNIEFTSDDYSVLLKKTGNDVFIFLDPPYYTATKSRLYGKKGILHTKFDHEKFYNDLVDCKHRWLITYDNSDYIKELFKDFYLYEWELQYGMNNYMKSTAEKGKELLVANYDIMPYLRKTQEYMSSVSEIQFKQLKLEFAV